MNMMTMAKMEEVIGCYLSTYRAQNLNVDERSFRHGFVSGAYFGQGQAKSEGSSPAAGNISHYPAAAEEPEEEV